MIYWLTLVPKPRNEIIHKHDEVEFGWRRLKSLYFAAQNPASLSNSTSSKGLHQIAFIDNYIRRLSAFEVTKSVRTQLING